MADSSSKEAMRALAVFLGAYMQGRQQDKERQEDREWRAVQLELTRQQIRNAENQSAINNQLKNEEFALQKKQYAEQQALVNQDRAQLDAFALQNGYPNYNAMDAALKQQKIKAELDAVAARNDPDAKMRDDLFQWDARLNAEESALNRQLNEIYELAKDPTTGQINPAILQDENVKKQLDPIRQRLATLAQDRGQLTELTRKMMGIAPAPVIPPPALDPGAGKRGTGLAELAKEKKGSQKSSWPSDATGKPKRIEEMSGGESLKYFAGEAAAKPKAAVEAGAKMFRNIAVPFTGPIPSTFDPNTGQTFENTGINPEKLKEYLSKYGGKTTSPFDMSTFAMLGVPTP